MPDPVNEVDGGEASEVDIDDKPRLDVFLGPGDLYFGDRTVRIRTLLGSCVAVTLWHPFARIGGMCHYVVPSRRHLGKTNELSGHYADEAIDLLLKEIHVTQPFRTSIR
jgi:chemotaxis protein CheD